MATALVAPLKWHGGKKYLASDIVQLMPRHLLYREPYFGSGKVLFARDPQDKTLWSGFDSSHQGVAEMVNDLDGRLTNFYRVLQDEDLFQRFARKVQFIPFSRPEWEQAHQHVYGQDRVADAVAFFVNNRQSWSGMGRTHAAVTRIRTRRGMDGNVSELLGAVDGLAEIHERLRRVRIDNIPAIDFMRREDTDDTLFYCDPPYPHETRMTTDAYNAFEMSAADHRELLSLLRQCKGKVMLSGYPSKLYDRALADWNRHTFDLPNNAAGGKTKARETEVVWCNF